MKTELDTLTGYNVKIMMIDDIEINCTNADICYVIDKFEPLEFGDDDNKLQMLRNDIDNMDI